MLKYRTFLRLELVFKGKMLQINTEINENGRIFMIFSTDYSKEQIISILNKPQLHIIYQIY